MPTFNVALIGLGTMGTVHLRVLQNLRKEFGFALAVYDSDKTKLSSYLALVREDTQIICSSTLENTLSWADVVVIATPTPTHFDIAKNAIHHHCNVFVEKPLTMASLRAEYLEKLAIEYKCHLSVGYIERFNPAFLSLLSYREYLDDIISFSAERVNLVPLEKWRSEGVLLDIGVHDLDLLVRLFGVEPQVDHCHSDLIHLNDTVVYSHCDMIFKTDKRRVHGSITSSWIGPEKRRVIYFRTVSSFIEMNLLQHTLIVKDLQTGNTVFNSVDGKNESEEPALVELRSFLSSCGRGSKLPTDFDECGILSQRAVEEILDSSVCLPEEK